MTFPDGSIGSINAAQVNSFGETAYGLAILRGDSTEVTKFIRAAPRIPAGMPAFLSALQIEGELGELVIQNCLAEEAIYRQGSVVRTAYMQQGSAFSPRVLVSPAEKGFALTEKEVLGCK